MVQEQGLQGCLSVAHASLSKLPWVAVEQLLPRNTDTLEQLLSGTKYSGSTGACGAAPLGTTTPQTISTPLTTTTNILLPAVLWNYMYTMYFFGWVLSVESDYTGQGRHSSRSRPVTWLLQNNPLVWHVINSFLSELLSMAMLNLLSLLKRYRAATMSIYFIQHPVKTIACITFYLLPSLPNMH